MCSVGVRCVFDSWRKWLEKFVNIFCHLPHTADVRSKFSPIIFSCEKLFFVLLFLSHFHNTDDINHLVNVRFNFYCTCQNFFLKTFLDEKQNSERIFKQRKRFFNFSIFSSNLYQEGFNFALIYRRNRQNSLSKSDFPFPFTLLDVIVIRPPALQFSVF